MTDPRLAAVRALHRDAYADTPDAGRSCTAGCGAWPCATIRALDAEEARNGSLRDRIAHALEREDVHWGYDHGFENRYGVAAETDAFVDAVLAVLPAPADRATEVDELRATVAQLRAEVDFLRRRGDEARQAAPAPADRATVLREAASVATDAARHLYDDMGQMAATGARYAAARIRRLADDAELAQRCGPECAMAHTETGSCKIARNQ